MKGLSFGPDDHDKLARKADGNRLRQSLRRAVNKIKTKIKNKRKKK